MNQLFPAVGLVVLLAGCAATPPRPVVSSNEVIGADFDPTVKTLPVKPMVSPGVRTGIWTVDDVKDWYIGYVRKEKGDEIGLLYQGSDANYHYFRARIPSAKTWLDIVVRKTDVHIAKERPDCHTAQPVRGYGFVDPLRNFSMVPRVGTPP